MAIKKEKPIETMTIYKEPVSPERARELLLHKNPNNRKLSKSSVAKYVHDMQLGMWDESAVAPIIFDKNDVLKNGEHRLTAIVTSGKTINMWFAYDAESTDTYDIGLKRTTTAILKMRGIEVTTNTVSVVRAIGSLCFGVTKPSEGEIEKAFLTDGETITEITKIALKGGHNAILKNSAIVSALYISHKCGVPINVIESFSRVANTAIVEEIGNNAPIILRGQAMKGISTWQTRVFIFRVTQEAIHDYMHKIDRRRVYTGKTAFFASKFVDSFRNGTLYNTESF